MKYCSSCGHGVEERIPAGDDRLRKVCAACGTVHYENPRVVVGCIIENEGKLLLCKRAIEPAHGRWTPPAGYLELGEGAAAGAAREAWEEAQVEVEILAPHAWFDLPHIGQLYQLFRARQVSPGFAPGPESLEVSLYDSEDLPWGELAFPVLHFALQTYLEDRRSGQYHLHAGTVQWLGHGSRFDARNYELREHRRVPYLDGAD